MKIMKILVHRNVTLQGNNSKICDPIDSYRISDILKLFADTHT